MSSKNCPETARQKMINMMYLVLTAMLALNVSAETLHAFKLIDSSLLSTFLSSKHKNDIILNDLKSAADVNSEKAKVWYDNARELQAKGNEVVSYIREIKEELARGAKATLVEQGVPYTDPYPIIVTNNGDSLVLKAQDDLNITPEIMLTKGRGTELQLAINEYKSYLVTMLEQYENRGSKSVIKTVNETVNVDDPKKTGNLKSDEDYRNWVYLNFESTPVIAAITMLSKYQNDIMNAESEVLRFLFNQIDATSYKFTGLRARVIPKSKFLFEGQQYSADIFLAAEDSTQEMKVFVNNSRLRLNDRNDAIYSEAALKEGSYERKGYIEYNIPGTDNMGRSNFILDFQVAKSAITVAPTKMNVLYRNLDNPISISVPGVPSDRIIPEFTNGKIIQNGDQWIVKPLNVDYNGSKSQVKVYAQFENEKRLMGEMKFRVKKVPDPIATVGGISSGVISRENITAQTGVFAQLKDFDFDLNFIVTSFDISVASSGGLTQTLAAKSYRFSSDQLRLLRTLNTGSKISIENIKARIEGDASDPIRPLNSIILTIQ